MSRQHHCTDALNQAALEHFFRQAVNREMIAFLADAAQAVVTHPAVMFPASPDIHNLLVPPPRGVESPSLRSVVADTGSFHRPTRYQVQCPVQVLTLMSIIICMAFLKGKLRPTAQGLRCTPTAFISLAHHM
ncbi:PHO85 cyclin-9 [Purpureocillium lavendulum]|uniref:PHO85 cyclin-9 n=1 Tax=Purpureocillium lavendulum TaxID=1247861 RepID=A0AB34FFX7_9HYPO|nr:PHO85 cyclin-9 [Purpureocillium lavendulum]